MYVLQALDVIRKLKAVMPIARANMLLRVVCPLAGTVHSSVGWEMGLAILRFDSSVLERMSQRPINRIVLSFSHLLFSV